MSKKKTMVLQECFSLRARIGWQGLRADEFLDYGPYLVTGTDFVNGKVNWDTCYHVAEERFKQDTGIQLHEHDLLVTKDGTIGKIAIVQNCPEKATLNSGVFVVRAINKSVVPSYLYYVLSSRDFELFLANTLTGSTIKHLNQEHFYKFKFEAPEDTKEQAKIAEVLATIDEAIDTTRHLIEKYRNTKSGLMKDLLASGEIVSLGDVADGFEYGMNAAATFYDETNKYIRITDIDDKNYTYKADDIVSPSGLLDAKYLLSDGDIVIARTGASTGKSYLYNPDDGKMYYAGFLIRLRVKTTHDPRYIAYQLQTNAYWKWVSVMSLRSGQPGINAQEYKSYKFPCLTDIHEQTDIADKLESIDSLIEKEEKYLSKLMHMKDGLMQDLLTQKVSVEPIMSARG